jgi:hypothetical protein
LGVITTGVLLDGVCVTIGQLVRVKMMISDRAMALPGIPFNQLVIIAP